jgi:hypothetical protein
MYLWSEETEEDLKILGIRNWHSCHTPEGMEDCIRSQGPLWTVGIGEVEKKKKEKQNVFICDNVHKSVSTLPRGLQPIQDSTNKR